MMRSTSLRSLALMAAATLVLSACASKQDPTVNTTTTGAGLGTYGAPNGGAGLGPDPYDVLGGGAGQGYDPNGLGSGALAGGAGVGSAGAIDGSALGGLGQGGLNQGGLYNSGGNLVDGGIITAAPQYSDGTVYTGAPTDNRISTYNDSGFTQPYDATLFEGVGPAAGSNTTGGSTPYSTFNPAGGVGTSLNGYTFPGDTGEQTYLTTQVGNRVVFETDSVILSAEAREILRRQAAWLLLHPEHTAVILEGHADERGTREYNLALGARRADAVRAFLSRLGVPAARLRTVSYGKERPLSLGSSPSDWAKNRRVETVLGGGASF